MYRVLIIFVIFLSNIQVFASDSFHYIPYSRFNNTGNYYPHQYPTQMTNGYSPTFINNNHYPLKHPYQMVRQTNFSDINALENYTLNRTYNRESDLKRLERLEMHTFGTIQDGELNTRYYNVRQAILSRPKQNYKTSFLGNLANFFSGQMTGYSPSVDSDQFFSDSSFIKTPYPSTYGNRNVDTYSTPWGGKGYRINDYGVGTSSGVKIID